VIIITVLCFIIDWHLTKGQLSLRKPNRSRGRYEDIKLNRDTHRNSGRQKRSTKCCVNSQEKIQELAWSFGYVEILHLTVSAALRYIKRKCKQLFKIFWSLSIIMPSLNLNFDLVLKNVCCFSPSCLHFDRERRRSRELPGPDLISFYYSPIYNHI